MKVWFPLNASWCPYWIQQLERFIRVRILNQPRYLIGVWTVERSEDLRAMHGIGLEKELIKSITQEQEKGINDRSLNK